MEFPFFSSTADMPTSSDSDNDDDNDNDERHLSHNEIDSSIFQCDGLGGSTSDDVCRRTFNEWRYADEASLYSIAEDSREARSSEWSKHSDRSGVGGGALAAASLSPSLQQQQQQQQQQYSDPLAPATAVEIRWITHDDSDGTMTDDSEAGQLMMNGSSVARQKDGIVAAWGFPKRRRSMLCGNRRRLLSVMMLVTLFVMIVCLAVLVPRRRQDNDRAAAEIAAIGGAAVAPTMPPTADRAELLDQLARQHVLDALSECVPDIHALATPPAVFESIPHKVVDQLVALVLQNGAAIDTTTSDNIALTVAPADRSAGIRQRFGLLVFYYTTAPRPQVFRASGDICRWEGVQCAATAREGWCAAGTLDFRNMPMAADLDAIPPELCCIKCLETVDLRGTHHSDADANNANDNDDESKILAVPSCLKWNDVQVLQGPIPANIFDNPTATATQSRNSP